MKTLTMITRHGMSKSEITAYTLITADYQTVQMKVADLVKAIKSGKVAVTNLTVGAKGIESTNGSLDKYTLISDQTGAVDGTPRAVVLDRVEKGDKLIGYTVFSQNGTIVELPIAEAVALCNQKLIANGKIRHTQQGDIVQSIGGDYPLREIEIDKAPKGELSTDVLYFAKVAGTPIEYVGAIVSCTSAAEMSKIAAALSKSNAKVVSAAVKVGGQDVRKSLSVKRMGANSFYGVFDLGSLEKLIKAGAKVGNRVGNIAVSTVSYKGGNTEEVVVTFDSKWNQTSDKTSAADNMSKEANEFAAKVKSTFGGVKIQ